MLSTQAKALKKNLLNELTKKSNSSNQKEVERIVEQVERLYNLTQSQIIKISEL